ncbi:hypothetical protein V6C27_08445 [Peptococcaceae bacterium 1198_IL3148]
MRPLMLATIVVATAVTSNGLLLNAPVIEAYNPNNLYRNLDHLTIPACENNLNETSKFNQSFDWAI